MMTMPIWVYPIVALFVFCMGMLVKHSWDRAGRALEQSDLKKQLLRQQRQAENEEVTLLVELSVLEEQRKGKKERMSNSFWQDLIRVKTGLSRCKQWQKDIQEQLKQEERS